MSDASRATKFTTRQGLAAPVIKIQKERGKNPMGDQNGAGIVQRFGHVMANGNCGKHPMRSSRPLLDGRIGHDRNPPVTAPGQEARFNSTASEVVKDLVGCARGAAFERVQPGRQMPRIWRRRSPSIKANTRAKPYNDARD
jgi:hypothetical protein